MPLTPQSAAGWRMEPPVSVAVAPGASRAATAAAEPPDEPPGTEVCCPGVFNRAVKAGFVGGAHGELVHIGFAQHHSAGLLEVFDHGGIVGGIKLSSIFEPQLVRTPSVQKISLCRMGTPQRSGALPAARR